MRFLLACTLFALMTTPVLAATSDKAKSASKSQSALARKAAGTAAAKPAKKLVAPGGNTAILTNPGSSAAYDDTPVPATSGGDRGLMAQAFVTLDRGQAQQAYNLAERIKDQVLADAVRGEAIAAGAPVSAAEIYSFLARHPDWPQRGAIAAAAEGQLPADTTYEPMLAAYTSDNPPTTTQGFHNWIATLRMAGRDNDARAAIRARWRSGKLSAAQEDDFKYRYGSILTGADTATRNAIMDTDVSERWKETHIRIRELFAQSGWREAYPLAARHGISPDNAAEYSAAEFIAGWLALRKLNQPKQALVHFNNLNDSVRTPVSRSRAAYWLGRTYEAMGDRSRAREAYEEGATYPTFFYGQLSIAKIYPNTHLHFSAEPAVPANVRATFDKRPLARVTRTLAAMGEQDRAARFLRVLANSAAETRADFVLADDLARDLGKPHLEVVVAKAANQKGFILGQRGFPTTNLAKGDLPETALALGIIRQESEFRSDAQSQAGALGMMQLMPNTAKGLARRAGVDFNERDLLQPAYNIQLGREYLGDRISEFNGSYILAIAAYNAGRGRVGQWLDIYGDPRSPSVDPIDWIETIPVYETRNYVQRVLENTQVYRALLARSSQPPLAIVADLQR